MKPVQREQFFHRLQQLNPQPVSELQWGDPYTLLVAVILSAQATDISVNKATPALFKRAATPATMLKLGEDKLRQLIRTIGLYNSKAKAIIAMSQQLLDKHGGNVPGTLQELEALAGVGRKTANVILNIAFNQPTIAVDTHVHRVANRTGLAPGKTPLEVETALLKTVPAAYRQHAHHWLILHGRYICQARKPLCGTCPVADLCGWKGKQGQGNAV
ncbi:MAG: endonuclease III [Candidatus Delongbacteria bacterium]|nr:endonuclease III [Candidatus Delongbacteria bacterium]